MLIEPLTPADAEILARRILAFGEVRLLGHATDRAAERSISVAECIETIRSGSVVDVHQRKGTWRYRFETETTAVAVLFESEDTMWFVTTYDPRDPSEGKRLEEGRS